MPFSAQSGRRRRQLLSVATAVPLLAVGLAVQQGPAAATEPPAGAPPAQSTDSHTVTLITGDVVNVTTLADGSQTAEVSRPDDAVGGVHLREIKGDLYVLPDEAMPLITVDKLDRQLFNVTDLIEMGYDDARAENVPLIATYTPAMARAGHPARAERH